MTPTTLRAFAGLLAALAVVLNGIAAGHLDPTQLGDAAIAFLAVISLIEAAMRSHSAQAPADAHDTTNTTPGATQ